MNYNGYPQNMNGMYNSYPYPQMPNQNMMPKYEVIKVKGKPGVDAFHMGPNSSVLLLDETANIVWYVETDGAASAETTVQISKNGTPLPYAQATGTNVAFVTFIQVDKNNCQCNVCSSPVTIQVLNSAAVTFTNVNITVDKVA